MEEGEERNSGVEYCTRCILSKILKVKAVSLQMTDNMLNLDYSNGNLLWWNVHTDTRTHTHTQWQTSAPAAHCAHTWKWWQWLSDTHANEYNMPASTWTHTNMRVLAYCTDKLHGAHSYLMHYCTCSRAEEVDWEEWLIHSIFINHLLNGPGSIYWLRSLNANGSKRDVRMYWLHCMKPNSNETWRGHSHKMI